MSYYIDYEVENTLGIDVEDVLKRVVSKVLELEACPYEVEVNFVLTDDASIRELNKTYRGLDKSTDVLSFPAIAFDSPSDFSGVEDAYDENFNPESGELMLGDIVVSIEHVTMQSKEYGHSVLREFAFLIAHSTLHLCGYDHMTPEEAQQMEQKQEAALNALAITREG